MNDWRTEAIEAGAQGYANWIGGGTVRLPWDHEIAAAVVDAVEPIIRADAIAEVREKHRAEMRALRTLVEALPERGIGDVIRKADVLALLEDGAQ